jgi:serpin B
MSQSTPSDRVDSQFVEAQNRFAFKLFSQIDAQSDGDNIFISPTSIAIALAMTYNGADGDTQAAMARTLELQGLSLDAVNQANAALDRSLENTGEGVKLAIANSLWLRQGVNFNSKFLQQIQKSYRARVESLDFNDPNAPAIINGWVAQQTNDKIEQIVGQISPQTLLYLINAIYFKGDWTYSFPEDATEDRPFTLPNGSEVQQPLMSRTGEYRYLETEEFQAIRLPYGEGNIGFYVFLPREESSLAQFYDRLDVQAWSDWIDRMRSRRGSISLPRFELEYDIELKETLAALGMEIAFTPDRANFSKMHAPPPSLAISQVKHKTFVEVNEAGTEAAAATSVGITATSVQEPQEPFNMTIDRPFFCAIRDDRTGAILFIGSIINP